MLKRLELIFALLLCLISLCLTGALFAGAFASDDPSTEYREFTYSASGCENFGIVEAAHLLRLREGLGGWLSLLESGTYLDRFPKGKWIPLAAHAYRECIGKVLARYPAWTIFLEPNEP
jgi:hypothetical protein